MNKYIKTTFIFSGVWFFAAVLNGLISGISIAVLDSSSTNDAMGNLVASFVFSFAFSVPFVGLVWFVTIMAQVAEKKGDSLLQLVLRTALFCSMGGALIFIYAFKRAFATARFIAGPGIIISALTAVLMFRKQIKTNE
jgi:hypothetical protein